MERPAKEYEEEIEELKEILSKAFTECFLTGDSYELVKKTS